MTPTETPERPPLEELRDSGFSRDIFPAGLNVMTANGIVARIEGKPIRGFFFDLDEANANVALFSAAPSLLDWCLYLEERVKELEAAIRRDARRAVERSQLRLDTLNGANNAP